MSKDAGVTHDTAARLIGIAPVELERLVRDGFIRRNDRNAYSVPVLIEHYVAWIKASVTGTLGHPKQADVAAHLDLSARSVRELELRLALPPDYSLHDFRIAYIRHLRETAAGRAASGDLDLATERARLASEQADRIAMQNAVARGELAPVSLIEEVLTKAAAKIAGIFDAIPGMVRRRVPSLGAAEIDLIADEIAKARNSVASISLADLKIDDEVDASSPPDLDDGRV
jgi:phage terminase Nu1 subunit (DNA packaging protein)